MTIRVGIIGCGPSGLLVAHAAAMSGFDFLIAAPKQKSRIGGAQYLHENVPGMTDDEPAAIVEYLLEGTPEGYRQKVYGDTYDGEVSPEEMGRTTQYAWDIRQCYDKLWNAYSGEIREFRAKSGPHAEHYMSVVGCDIVVSTAPRTIWDPNPDNFKSAVVWAISDDPDNGVVCPFRPARENTVLCDGTEDVSWYRAASIFGYSSVEWPGDLPKPPVDNIVRIRKPLSHTSKAAPDFYHLGRYGEWRKGVLTTDAFGKALRIFSK